MTLNEIIRQRFPHERTQSIADDLGFTYSQVANRAFSMGLKKTLEFKKSESSGRYNLIEGGKKFRFVPGHAPHNKGVKMPDEVYNKVKRTMFKKGIKPHNTQPVGTINLRLDKNNRVYAYIKIRDSYWRLIHRVIWEQHHGPIPSKHIVTFKDGNALNWDISNLECISMKQNINNNTIQRYPEELQQVMKLTAKLNRKINGKEQN
jgi:hypothetical protein